MLAAGAAFSAVVKGETANNALINKIDHQYQTSSPANNTRGGSSESNYMPEMPFNDIGNRKLELTVGAWTKGKQMVKKTVFGKHVFNSFFLNKTEYNYMYQSLV